MLVYESHYYGTCMLGSNELYHHGIKGMKWGVRRYQNDDGSLTAAGRKRYFTDDGHLTKSGIRKYKKEYKKLQKLKDRSNIELQNKKAEKYDKRAGKALKVAVISGAAAVGGNMAVKLVRRGLHVQGNKIAERLTSDTDRIIGGGTDKLRSIATRENWATRPQWTGRELDKLSIASKTQFNNSGLRYNNARNTIQGKLNKLHAINNVRKAVTIGAASISAGVAIYSKLQAHASKKRVTELGHEKAVQNVKQQIQRMNQMFGDIKLSEITKKRK